jgi:hypothetical protein
MLVVPFKQQAICKTILTRSVQVLDLRIQLSSSNIRIFPSNHLQLLITRTRHQLGVDDRERALLALEQEMSIDLHADSIYEALAGDCVIAREHIEDILAGLLHVAFVYSETPQTGDGHVFVLIIVNTWFLLCDQRLLTTKSLLLHFGIKVVVERRRLSSPLDVE